MSQGTQQQTQDTRHSDDLFCWLNVHSRLEKVENFIQSRKEKDLWDKLRIFSGVFAAIAVPVIVCLTPIVFQFQMKDRDRELEIMKLAVEVLREPQQNVPIDIRRWAAMKVFPDDEQARKSAIEASLLSFQLGRFDGLKELIDNLPTDLSDPASVKRFQELINKHRYDAVNMISDLTSGANPRITDEELREIISKSKGEDLYKAIAEHLISKEQGAPSNTQYQKDMK